MINTDSSNIVMESVHYHQNAQVKQPKHRRLRALKPQWYYQSGNQWQLFDPTSNQQVEKLWRNGRADQVLVYNQYFASVDPLSLSMTMNGMVLIICRGVCWACWTPLLIPQPLSFTHTFICEPFLLFCPIHSTPTIFSAYTCPLYCI